MNCQAKWIKSSEKINGVCPVFQKTWKCSKKVVKAELLITALGVYEANINGNRVGDFVLAPGWTSYENRLQYQVYEVSKLLKQENTLQVLVGKGWFSSPMPGWMDSEDKRKRCAQDIGTYCELKITYEDGTSENMLSDKSWEWGESKVRFSEVYDGETYDATFVTSVWKPVVEFFWNNEILIPQEGEIIKEQDRIVAQSVFVTPLGETVVDFGQEVTGYVEFNVDAREGDKIIIQHGEVLDSQGNFYRENYRSAKSEITYICKEGKQTYHPQLTFYGFRYLKLVQFPGKPSKDQFTAIVVHSDLRRTGRIQCSNYEINQLFSNIIWGQKGNFLDVPTDCPQRDERLGWTGDAQAFVKTATYNYDVEKFFKKWLHDMSADQRTDGAVGQVIPDYIPEGSASAAWGDAATICPWQIYMTYGDPKVLEDQFDCMRKWVDYITGATKTPGLWTEHFHFGDWLGLDAPVGSYKGSSREDLIATAFYAHSTSLVIKAGKVLGKDISEYEKLYQSIVSTFRHEYKEYKTQTEHVLAIHFCLAENLQETADALAALIRNDGMQMKTGFVGTPYLLHVLTDYGYTDIAYSLLLRQEYPSWLYPVQKGATTIWEHWDGIMENGDFWSADMNSFNHYAYGAVADWLYEKAAGIQTMEEAPGFERVVLDPHPDKRLEWLEAELQTRHGKVYSKWSFIGEKIRYEIEVEMPATIRIGEKTVKVMPGNYLFWN